MAFTKVFFKIGEDKKLSIRASYLGFPATSTSKFLTTSAKFTLPSISWSTSPAFPQISNTSKRLMISASSSLKLAFACISIITPSTRFLMSASSIFSVDSARLSNIFILIASRSLESNKLFTADFSEV